MRAEGAGGPYSRWTFFGAVDRLAEARTRCGRIKAKLGLDFTQPSRTQK
jgi:hypothetical protein